MSTIEEKIVSTEIILSLWEKYTLQPCSKNVDFFESGGDSLSAINMIVELQKTYNVEISLESFMRKPTISFLIDIVEKNTVEAK